MAWTEISLILATLFAPTADKSLQRAALLAELRAATEAECDGHDVLIERYEAALAETEGAEGSLQLRIGRAQAYALRRQQTGRLEDDELLEDEVMALGQQQLDVTQQDEVDALRDALRFAPSEVCKAHSAPLAVTTAEPEPSPEPSPEPVQPKPSASVPPPTSSSAPSPPEPWRRRERTLVIAGSLTGALGVGAVVAGIVGPFVARAGINGNATAADQEFLDVTVPRRSAAWASAGSALVGVGTGLLVSGLVQRRCRRTDRC
jgi:hypothetical protein